MPRREAFEAPEAPSEALSEALPKNKENHAKYHSIYAVLEWKNP